MRLLNTLWAAVLGLTLGMAGGTGAQAVYVPSQTSDILGLQTALSRAGTGLTRTYAGSRSNVIQSSQGVLSDATYTAQNTRCRFFCPRDASYPSLVFSCPADAPNSIIITAGLEMTSLGGTIMPVTFAGKQAVTIDPGGVVVSDPIGVVIPANTFEWSRVYIQPAVAGGRWAVPTPFYPNAAADGQAISYQGTAAPSDLSKGGTFPGTYNSLYSSTAGNNEGNVGTMVSMIPDAVMGTVVSTQHCLGVVGDSIAAGQYDFNFSSGFFLRGVSHNLTGATASVTGAAGGFGAVRFAISGATIGGIYGQLQKITQYLQPVTETLHEGGVNDLSNGASLATMQTSEYTTWSYLNNLGKKVGQTTITPRTQSSDNWATTTNQTAVQVSSSSGEFGSLGGAGILGTATSGTATTLTDTTKTWTTNAYTGYCCLITGGTGAGQSATITSNTATSLTVSAWQTRGLTGSVGTGVVPDATSAYRVDSVRNCLNDWIRTNPAPLSFYVDIADAVESGRNSGLWRTPDIDPGTGTIAMTFDGTHPANIGNSAANLGGIGRAAYAVSLWAVTLH